MPDFSSWTSLPNLHPAVVHFPLALLPMAILFDLLGLAMRRQEWLERAAATLYGAAALGAIVAKWAGERAADSLIGVPALVEPRIAEHSDWAHYSTYALGVLAVLRLSAMLVEREAIRTALRALVVVLALGALALLGYTADLGGALVYQHAVAVALPAAATESPPPPPTTEDVGPATSRLVRQADGTHRWDPLPGDSGALGEILTPAAGFSVSAVTADPAGPGTAGTGLTLKVDGTTLLLLPGIFGDVRVEATLELIDFAGSVGVAHHVGDASARGLASLSTDGRAALVDRRDGRSKVLHESAVDVPEGPFTLAVSSSGRHLKSLLDGKTVTHGHIAAGPEGGCGLYLDGTGILRVVSLLVTPLQGH